MGFDDDEVAVDALQASGALLVEDGNHGEYRPRPDEFVDKGVAFIRAADMSDGRVLFASASRINERAVARIRKGIGRPGDVVLSHKGTVGKVSLAPLDAPPFVCSPQTTFWRVLDEDRIDRGYLFAYMRSEQFRAKLASRSGETDMAGYVSLTSQRQLTLPIPDIATQRSIGAFLSLLDDRIDNLRATNATLEAIAQALFKSWFVDFDPVHAKAEGRAPEGMDAATAALFPSEFEDSELSPIPKGWRVTTVGDVADLVKGCSYKGAGLSDSDGAYMFNLGCFNEKRIFATEKIKRYTGGYREKQSVAEGDLIVANTDMTQHREILGRPLFVPSGCEPGFVSHHIFKVVPALPNKVQWKQFLFFAFQQAAFRERAVGYATGTTVLALPRDSAEKCPIVDPGEALLTLFGEVVTPLLSQIANNLQREKGLEQLRDTLLPRLISGKLRLPEASAGAEAAFA